METDKEIIHRSLAMRKNYIQTGDISLSAIDANNCGKKDKIKPLTTDQMKLIIRIEELMLKCLDNK